MIKLTKLGRIFLKKLTVYEKCKELYIARSVVDIRQPFFVEKSNKVLTVEEKLGLLTH